MGSAGITPADLFPVKFPPWSVQRVQVLLSLPCRPARVAVGVLPVLHLIAEQIEQQQRAETTRTVAFIVPSDHRCSIWS